MIRASALYPSTPGQRFDFDYYTNKHVPMVTELMRPFGLISVEIDRGLGGMAPGAPPPFSFAAHFVFDSLEQMQAGLMQHAAQIFGDLPNYTDTEPQMQFSQIVMR